VQRVLFRVSSLQQRLILAAARPYTAVFCQSDHQFCDLLNSQHTALVWESSSRMRHGRDPIPRDVVTAAGRLPLLVHAELGRANAEMITRLGRQAPDSRVSLEGFDTLVDDIDAMLINPSETPADHVVISCTIDGIDPSIRDIMLCAAIAGKRRIVVTELARGCQCSVRHVEARLHRAGVPGPRRLLGLSLSLHTAWRLEVLEWSAKKTAGAAGLESLAALGGYVQRHSGSRPRALRRAGAFDALLHHFLRIFSIAGHDPDVITDGNPARARGV
jgi:hypothetical protein